MKRAAFWIYAACLVSAPILFGAVHAWTYTFVFLGILLASALVFLGELGERLPPPLRRLCGQGRRRAAHPAMPASAQGGPSGRSLLLPSALFFLAVVLFLAFQMTALPEGLLRLVSPMAKIAGDLALPPWETASGEAVPGRAYSVAPYAYPVRMSLVRWIVYGLLFFGLLRTLDSRRRITGLVTALLVLACLDALYGLMESSSAARHVLWMKALGGQKDVSGTFINRNHFAGFMEMGIILAVLYAGAYGHGEKRGRRPPASRKTGWRGLLLGWTAGEAAPVRRALIVFAGAVMFVALILSASRAGIVTAVFVLFLVGGLLTLRRRQRKMGLVVLALFCVTASYALTIGIDYTIQRFQAIHGYRDDARGVMTQDALRLFRDYRLVGVGFGNFAHAYPRYQSPILKGELVGEAHNDWAQLLAEGGVAGFVLVLAGVGCLVFGILRQWRRREDTFATCLGLAPVAVLGAMAVHSFFDFNLHIPANFLTMVAIATLGAASLAPKKREGASVPERLGQGENALFPGRLGRGESAPFPREETDAAPASPGGPGTAPPSRERRGPRGAEPFGCGNHGASSLFFAALLGLACWSGYWTVRHFVAEAYCNTEVVSPLRLPEHPPLPHIEAALAWDPANAEYGYRKARALMAKRDALGAVGFRMADDEEGWIEDLYKPRRFADGAAPFSLERHIEDNRARHLDRILAPLQEAVRRNPFQAEYRTRLGWELTYRHRANDYLTRWLPAADRSMEAAAYYAGNWMQNPHLHVDLGNYWVYRSRTLGYDPAGSEVAWIKALWHYYKAQELDPANKRFREEIRRYVQSLYPDGPRVREALKQ